MQKIIEEEQLDYFLTNHEEIRDYIHKAQKDIIEDALNMYNVMAHSQINSIMKCILTNKRSFLNLKEFNDAVKEDISHYTVLGLTPEDVKRILPESGLIGQLYKEYYVNEINYNALVYPLPLDDKDDNILKQLSDKNILF